MKQRKKEFFRAFKFVLFSASAGLIEMGLFALLNRRFTFRSTARVTPAMLKVLGYYAIFTPLTTILGDYMAEDLQCNEYLVTIANMLLNVSTEFLFQKYVVYRNKIDNRVK